MTKLKDESLSELLKNVSLDSSHGLVQQIYSLLNDLIANISLKPGQRISEKDVAESLNASKTPVREAMIKLEDAGLVKIIPKSGTYVSPISLERYIEACFTRLQLEIGAVRRAANRNNDLSSILKLEATINKQAKALEDGEQDLFFQYDEALHESFFEMAGVMGVWNTVKKSQTDVYRIRHLKRIYKISRGPQVLDEHKAIVAAIRAGSPDDAEAAIIRHIGSLESEIDLLSSNPDLLEFIESLNVSGKH